MVCSSIVIELSLSLVILFLWKPAHDRVKTLHWYMRSQMTPTKHRHEHLPFFL